TAEEIASGMYGRLPRCDLASVYRNLDTLEELGLVRHMHLGHGPGLYAPAARDDEYVACERCGRSEAVSRDVLSDVRPAVQTAAETAVGIVIIVLALRLLRRPHHGRPARTPLQAYGIGVVHGMGGSAGVGVLLLAAISNHVEALVALVLFAVCTAISMAA